MRPNRSVQRISIGFGVVLAFGLAASEAHAQAALPTIDVRQGQLVLPSTAFYDSPTPTHTRDLPSVLADHQANRRRPEIKELARGLGAAQVVAGQLGHSAYADRVHEYVRQNIAVDFMFGLQKGALGALIDQRGTPFDQAHLMVELLREAGVTANYQAGRIVISDPVAFGRWTGATDARLACRLLADGGIPGAVNGSSPADCNVSGAITSVEMRHVWVSAAGKLFDPSYKLHNTKTGIDLAAAMNCGTAAAPTCYSTLRTALSANAGTSGGVPFMQGLTKATFDNQLRTFATTLQSTLQQTYPNALVDDIVGGRSLDLASFVPATATLPYSVSGTPITWTDGIPNEYRTRLTVQYDNINRALYVDEIYGKRTHLEGILSNRAPNSLSATRRVSLYVEYELLAVSTRAAGTVENSVVTITVNHPYAASGGAYMDQTVTSVAGQTVVSHDAGTAAEVYFSPTTIVHGWGGAGAGTVTHFTKHKEYADVVLPLKDPFVLLHDWECVGSMPWNFEDILTFGFITPPNSTIGFPMWPTCNQQAQPLLAANWLAQRSAALDLIARINSAPITEHHAVGTVTSDRFGHAFNVSSGITITSLLNSPADRQAAAYSLSAISSHLEANVLQQGDDGWEAWSAIAAWVHSNQLGRQFALATSANIASALSQLSGYTGAELARIQAYVSSGHAVILPKQAVIYSWQTLHTDRVVRDAVFAFKPNGESVAHVLAGSKGARTSSFADPTTTVYNSVKPSQAPRTPQEHFGADLAQGAFTLRAPVTFTTGVGGFPNSLSMEFVYSSHDSDAAPCDSADCLWRDGLGNGWDFTLNALATMGSDGLQAMGQDSALDATATVAALFVLRDAGRTVTDATSGFAPAMVSAFTTYWWGSSLINNAVTVRRPPSTATFIKLPNDAFNPPPSSAERLVQIGTRSVPFPQAVLANGYYNYHPVSIALTDKSGATLTFRTPLSLAIAPPPGVQVTYDRTFVAESWVFPTGIRVDYEYVNSGSPFFQISRTAIRNNLGRRLNFGADAETFQTVISDETTTRSTRFGPVPGVGLSLITPDGKMTSFTYEFTASLDAPRVSSVLNSWTSPANPGAPLVQIQYDTLTRLSSISVAPNNAGGVRSVTNYFVSTLGFNENVKRAEARDPLNAVTTSYFGKFGEELQTIDPLGRITTKTYDSRQRLKRVIQPEAHVDAAGNPRPPAGNWVEYSYDSRHNVTETRRRAKQGSARPDIVTTATFPAACTAANQNFCNQPSSTADARGRITSYLYYSDGQLRRVTGPTLSGGGGNARTDLCYSPFGPAGNQFRLLTGKIDVVGGGRPNRVASYGYNSGNRFVLSSAVVDPTTTLTAATSETTTCTTSSKSGALNLTTAFTFDAAGNVSAINGPRPDSPIADVTTYLFDASRQLRQIDGPSGTDLKAVFDYYDDGSLKTIDRQEIVGGAPVMRRETRAYWPSGDLLTITDPKNDATRRDYDLTGRVTLITDPDARRVGTVYDAAGQARCVWNGWNSATAPTSCTWDPNTYVAAGNNGPLRYAEYTYTVNGQQRTVTDAKNNMTEYVYDNHDKLRYTFFPNASNGSRCVLPAALPGGVETGSPTCTAGGGTTPRYEDLWYTSNGTPTGTLCSGDVQVCRKRTRAGQAITFTYDELNRMRTKAAASLPTVTYAYTLLDEPVSLTSPLSGSIPAHGIQYDYDDAGRKRFEENLVSGSYRRVSYSHDEAGNRVSTTWPDTYTVRYRYDPLNRMTQVWEGALDTGVKLADYTYDSLSRRKSLRFAGSASNETTYTYEADGQLDLLTHSLAAANGFNLNYGHTAAGRIKTIVASDDFFLPTPAVAPATPFVPNRLNQYGTFAGQSAAYNSNGNLANWVPPGQSRHTYTYDSESRLRTAAVDGTTTPTITYDYDPLGRRLSKIVTGTNPERTGYLFDGDEEIGEYGIDAGGVWSTTPLRRYITGPGIDDRVATIDAVDGIRYYHVNHQGSVLATTNASGSTACSNCQRMSYDEYGNLGASSVATGQPYRYTGRRFDQETGLYHYRARYYSPVLGRFLQTDPVGYNDDVNLYAYVKNDPLNASDPTGEAEYRVLYGDPGLGRHNVGRNFQRAAETRAAELRAEGHSVTLSSVSTVGKFNAAITGGSKIDGGVEYFGHGWTSILYPGETAGPDTNIDAGNIDELSGENLAVSAMIILNSCNSGAGGAESIAQLLANQLGVSVKGSEQPLGFTGEKDVYLHGADARPPDTGPLYMTPPKQEDWETFGPKSL